MEQSAIWDAILWIETAKEGIAARRELQSVLHVHVGLAVFLGCSLALRRPRGAWLGLGVVAILQIANEVADHLVKARMSMTDIVLDCINTLLWPLVLALLFASGLLAKAFPARKRRHRAGRSTRRTA